MKTAAVIMALGMVTLGAAGGDTVPKLVEGNTAFALDLFRELGADGENLCFSPFSISVALGMTYAGARGVTERQMAEVLHFPDGRETPHPLFGELLAHLRRIEGKEEVRLRIANALWIEKTYPILEAFLKLNQGCYGAEPRLLDFIRNSEESRRMINRWVAERTEEKIPDLIPPKIIDKMTRMVLTNAVYFLGEWAGPFHPRATQELDFHTAAAGILKVPTMFQKARFGYAEKDFGQILELPYEGEDISMLILLPKARKGLPALEERLTAPDLLRWTEALPRIEVKVFLPKFKVRGQFPLRPNLESLGMREAFTRDADFSGMEPKQELFISAVIHEAFVNVDEAGTEAAAATAVIMAQKAAMPIGEPPVFRADHPFLFMIRDNLTGSLLFIGRVGNPDRE